MKYIGIIGAMQVEVEHLTAKLTNPVLHPIAGRIVFTGILAGKEVCIVQSGMGKVAAAATAQMLIDHFDVGVLINTGMGGGLSPELNVKDLVIGSEAVEHDFNLRALGYVRGSMNEKDKSTPTMFAANETMIRLAKEAADEVLPAGSKAIVGTVASADLFVSDAGTKAKLRKNHNAVVAEMEGAAIAHVASDNGVPFVILRTISDLAEGDAEISFHELEEYVGELAENITEALLKRL